MAEEREKLVFIMIGPRRAGKTVFLAALANAPTIASGDPAAIKLLKLHWRTLREGKTPPATGGTFTELEFFFRGEAGGRLFDADFIFPDYDGRFTEILSDYEAGQKGLEDLRRAFERADGFIVFLPWGDDDAETMDAARFELGHFIRIVRLCREGVAKINAPVIILVNKWDKSPDFKSADEDAAAAEYVRSRESYRSILAELDNFFANVFIIPVSAYGHVAPGDAPAPGAIAPWRVTEPVATLIAALFADLAARVEELERRGDWRALDETLTASGKLWQASDEKENYARKLSEARARRVDELLARLREAKTFARWNEIFTAAGGPELVAGAPSDAKTRLLDARRAPLDADCDALFEKLKNVANLAEYKRVWADAPEAAGAPFFSATGQARLGAIEERLARDEKSRKRRASAKWIALFLILSLAVAIGARYWQVESRFLDAMDQGQTREERARKLRDFHEWGVNSPFTVKLFAGKFSEAARERAEVEERTRVDLRAELDELEKLDNPTEIAPRADALIARADGADAEINERARALRERAARAMEIVARLERASSPPELETIRNEILTSPDAGSRRELLARVENREKILAENNRRQEAENQRKAMDERARREREEAERIIEAGDYRRALELAARRDSSSPDIEQALPRIFYRNMENCLREDGDERDLAYLLDQKEIMEKLTESQKRSLLSDLRRRLAALFAELREELAAPATTSMALDDLRERLSALEEIVARLRASPFSSVLEPTWSEALAAGAEKLRADRRLLTEGADASGLTLIARQPNSLDLGSGSIFGLFSKDGPVLIRFPDGTEKIWRKDDGAEERDGQYLIDFGPTPLRRAYGEISVENAGADKRCSSPWRVESEIFALTESGRLLAPLTGSCRGLALEFKK